MRRTLAILLFVGAIWLWADRAHAIAFLSHKEEILYLRDLPPKAREEARRELDCAPVIGFHYHRIYVVRFCDMWTWGGSFVLYKGDKYWPMEDAELQKLLGDEAYGALVVPWTYHYPPGALILAGVCILGCLYRICEVRAERAAAMIASDPKYQRALEIYKQNLSDDHEAGSTELKAAISAGVGFLVAQGIPEDRATRNFLSLLERTDREKSASGPPDKLP